VIEDGKNKYLIAINNRRSQSLRCMKKSLKTPEAVNGRTDNAVAK
jgi:hypothetical protein